MKSKKFIATTIFEYLNENKISWCDYINSQFDENEDRYLPNDYFGEEFEIKTNTKHKYPVLLDTINSIEYREYKFGGIGVFDNDKQIGFGDNGTIQVAKDYQKRGIGVELVHLIKLKNPNHRFGSMTPQGWNLMRSYYDKKVK